MFAFMETNKRGPKAKYDFDTYPIGHEIELKPLNLPSFKSTLSTFNSKFVAGEQKHVYKYEQPGRKIVATRTA